jgi:hypothetical protein
MAASRSQYPGISAAPSPASKEEADALNAPPMRSPHASSSPHDAADRNATPYGLANDQLEALSAVAYLTGSPLQSQQPSGGARTHPALLVAAKLLQQGVDPERIIQLVECRYGASVTD